MLVLNLDSDTFTFNISWQKPFTATGLYVISGNGGVGALVNIFETPTKKITINKCDPDFVSELSLAVVLLICITCSIRRLCYQNFNNCYCHANRNSSFCLWVCSINLHRLSIFNCNGTNIVTSIRTNIGEIMECVDVSKLPFFNINRLCIQIFFIII